MSYNYEMWNVHCENRVATVTINNPPINLGTIALYEEFYELTKELSADNSLSVVVIKSGAARSSQSHSLSGECSRAATKL